MTRALLKFDKRKVAKARPRKAQSKVYSSIKPPTIAEARSAAQKLRAGNPAKKAKRAAKNKAYYSSAEWRSKRKAVFERDEYQCVEIVEYWRRGVGGIPTLYGHGRCAARGEWINGKQTSRGLVCEESSYGHRGIPDRIDTCKTRCKDCDRRKTPLERANHANGFRKPSSAKTVFGERAE